MVPYDELDDATLQELLNQHRANLAQWATQDAQSGPLDTRVNLKNQIDHAKREMLAIRAELSARTMINKPSVLPARPEIRGMTASRESSEEVKESLNKLSSKKVKFLANVAMASVLVLLGGVVLWQYIKPESFSDRCTIQASEISLTQSTIHVGEGTEASIRVENPDGRALVYNWQAVHGKMTPSLRTNSTVSYYLSPNVPVDETISVDIIVDGCNPVRRSKEILVLTASSTSTKTPTSVLTTPPETPQNAQATSQTLISTYIINLHISLCYPTHLNGLDFYD